jgi:hypothetical protein
MKSSMGGGCCTQLMPIKALSCLAAATTTMMEPMVIA